MFDSDRADKKTLYLLYDDATTHYSVITNVAGCFAQRYICQGCKRGEFHNCDATCSDCLAVPPCEYGEPGGHVTTAIAVSAVTRVLSITERGSFRPRRYVNVSAYVTYARRLYVVTTSVLNRSNATVKRIASRATSVTWPCCPSRCRPAPRSSMCCTI